MNKKIDDIQFGLNKEDEYFNILKDCFDETLLKIQNVDELNSHIR
jgi:hypothetical protein